MRSVEVVVMVVLGGAGSISGGILAAVLLTILPEALRPLQQLTGVDLRMVLYSLLLIMLMLARPQGLLGRRELWQMRRRP
jgi:branched-chain amino acid transport system permease protein